MQERAAIAEVCVRGCVLAILITACAPGQETALWHPTRVPLRLRPHPGNAGGRIADGCAGRPLSDGRESSESGTAYVHHRHAGGSHDGLSLSAHAGAGVGVFEVRDSVSKPPRLGTPPPARLGMHH